MTVKSIGIMAVSVDRLKNIYVKYDDKFLSRFFTNDEITYVLSKRDKLPTLAGRLALKIALCKAMGKVVALKEIEINNDDKGKPFVKCLALGNLKCEASISHERDLAVATVVIF